MSKAFLVWKPV